MEKLTKGISQGPEESTSAEHKERSLNSDVPPDEIKENKDVKKETANSSSSSSDSNSSDSDSDSEFECDVCNKTFSNYLAYKQHIKGKKHAKVMLKKKKEKKLKKIDTVTESDEEQLIQEPYAECKICSKEFYGPESYGEHLKCKKHKRKVLELSILEQVQEEGKINEDKLRELCKKERATDEVLEDAKLKVASLSLNDEDGNEEEEYECAECDKTFSGLIPYTQHLMSKTHGKKIEKKILLNKINPSTSKDESVSENSKQLNTLCIEDDVLICKSCSTSFSGPENAMTHIRSKKHLKNFEKYVRKLERKEKKQSKNGDLNTEKESKITPESEDPSEKRQEKVQPTSDVAGELEASNSSKNTVKFPSSSKDKEELLAYEKYKEYKKMMNSIQKD